MLTQKSTPSLNLTDQTLSRVQQNIKTVLDPVLQTPLIDGVLVQNLVIPAATTLLVVPHNLGRRCQGWHIVAASAAYGPPYAPAAAQTSPNNAVMLQFPSGAGATISVWVF